MFSPTNIYPLEDPSKPYKNPRQKRNNYHFRPIQQREKTPTSWTQRNHPKHERIFFLATTHEGRREPGVKISIALSLSLRLQRQPSNDLTSIFFTKQNKTKFLKAYALTDKSS